MALDGLLAYLFYDRLEAVILLIPVSILYLRKWRIDCCLKKETLFRSQFQNSIQLLVSALKAGYSVENAIRETEKDLRPLYQEGARIRVEFEKMVRELNMNRTVEQVLKGFADRTRQEDVENFVTVFTVAKRTGGDSIAILQDTVSMIGNKIETEQEIQTILASNALEFEVMCAIPLGMIWYMRLAFPEFLEVLYGNLTGVLFMSISLGIYVFAYWLGNKIIQIRV